MAALACAIGLFGQAPPLVAASDLLFGRGRFRRQFLRGQRLQAVITALGQEFQALVPITLLEAIPTTDCQAGVRIVGGGLEPLLGRLESPRDRGGPAEGPSRTRPAPMRGFDAVQCCLRLLGASSAVPLCRPARERGPMPPLPPGGQSAPAPSAWPAISWRRRARRRLRRRRRRQQPLRRTSGTTC